MIIEDTMQKSSPEGALAQAMRHFDASEIPAALRELERGILLVNGILEAARVDAAQGVSYAPDRQRNRLLALRKRIADSIVRLEAARREVESELTAVRSQKAFGRPAEYPSWFESRV
jgi:hypothetical protein